MSGENDYREKGRALFLAAIMVVSVFGMTAAFAGSAAAQTTLTVDADNSNNYDTVQNAVDNASNGDIIEIADGTYDETVTFDSSLSNITIKASDGANPPEITGGMAIKADVSDLTVEDVELSGDSGSSRTFQVAGGSLTDVTLDGVSFEGNNTQNSAIYGNAIAGNVTLTGVTVANYMADDWRFVYIAPTNANEKLKNVEITGSIFQDSVGMIAFGEISNSITVEDNSFAGIEADSGGAAAAALALGDPALGESAVASISNNTFSDNFNHVVLGEVDGESIQSVVDSNDFDRAVYTDSLVSSSIQNAVDDAESGDMVQAGPGTYNESVSISTANVTLESTAGADNTVVALDEQSSDATIGVEASNVTLDGFTIKRINGDAYSQSVAIRATDGVTVSNNTLTRSGGTSPAQGLLITDNSGDQSNTTNVAVEGNEIRNFDHGIAISTQDTDSGGISGVDVEDNTIESNTIGVKVSDFTDTNEEINATITGNEISGNEDGIRVLDDDTGPAGTNPAGVANLGQFLVHNNNIVDNTNSGITNEASGSDNVVDARLNWWGSDTGPGGVAAGNGSAVSENVEYNPFLTAPKDQVATSPDELTKFGFSTPLAGGTESVVAVPGPTDRTVGEMFNLDEFNGTVYRFDAENDQWNQVSASDEVNALDAFVVVTDEGETAHATISFAEGGSEPSAPTDTEIQQGWNLVGAPQNGSIEAAFAASSAEPARALNSFEPSEADGDFSVYTFGTESDGPNVDPTKGYWIYANDNGTLASNLGSGESLSDVDAKLFGK